MPFHELFNWHSRLAAPLSEKPLSQENETTSSAATRPGDLEPFCGVCNEGHIIPAERRNEKNEEQLK